MFNNKINSLFILVITVLISITGVLPVHATKNTKNYREIKINLEVGESYYDEVTGITIKRLPDDYESKDRLTRASDKVFHDDLNGETDCKNNFTLTEDMRWWKVEWRSDKDGNSLEIYSKDDELYTEYNFEKGTFYVHGRSPEGTYTVHLWNGTKGLYGWIACRIADREKALNI
ncbi:hypothetical protein [Tissierella praeacuta]|uniref:hypothetical protein n=1 Tax=Tissierella praeacuta TaxID=43131 RepID=UPI0028AFBC01|nr:hypothetical protein [Tissierella praeacuta]